MLWRFLRALRHYPRRWGAAALILAALALLTWWYDPAQRAFTGAAILTGGTSFTWWFVYWLVLPVTTGTWVRRRDDASEHAGGVASRLDVGELASAGAMRRRARVLRPSLRRASWWRVRLTSVRTYAVPLVRSGWFRPTSTVWSSCEDVTMRIGGPRTGKSGSLACHALDAPGALIVTTSRTDLLDETRAHRERLGRIEVFNPTGLGNLASTVRWSPLAGCTDLATAQRRAADLIPESTGEAERWDAQARALLAVLLHAAAHSGGSLRTVLDWVSPADEVSRDEVLAALRPSPTYRALSSEVRSIYGTNDRTLTSITTTLLPAVRWLADTTASQVGDAPLDHPDFLDVAELVSGGKDSLYLIGREGACRALVGALTAEIAHQARMAAAASPGGRLEPALTMVLDEAPLTCGPIPLQDWTADMGGRNVTLHLGAQSLAQLRDVWGPERAEAICGNVGALLVFGGIKAATDLEQISTLAGTHLVQLDADDRRPMPVMTAAQVAGLPMGTALVLRNGMRPIVGRAPMVWERRGRRWSNSAVGRAARTAATVALTVARSEQVQDATEAVRKVACVGASRVAAAARSAGAVLRGRARSGSGDASDRTADGTAEDARKVPCVDASPLRASRFAIRPRRSLRRQQDAPDNGSATVVRWERVNENGSTSGHVDESGSTSGRSDQRGGESA